MKADVATPRPSDPYLPVPVVDGLPLGDRVGVEVGRVLLGLQHEVGVRRQVTFGQVILTFAREEGRVTRQLLDEALLTPYAVRVLDADGEHVGFLEGGTAGRDRLLGDVSEGEGGVSCLFCCWDVRCYCVGLL